MIRLDLKREPHWLDLGHGARVHVRPCTTALLMAARAEVQRAPVSSANDFQAAERTAALVKALGRLAVQAWDGVGQADGEPAPLTPEGVDALLDLWGRWRRPSSGSTWARRCCWTTKKRICAHAEWHFGGGPGYCASCVALDRPCARGKPGADGHRCPYLEHEPLTDVGWQAWDVVIRCSGQLRLAPNAAIVIGINLGAALSLGAALGHDVHALAELLPSAEARMLNAINRRLVSGD